MHVLQLLSPLCEGTVSVSLFDLIYNGLQILKLILNE